MKNISKLMLGIIILSAMVIVVQGCNPMDTVSGKKPATTETKPAEPAATTPTEGGGEATPPAGGETAPPASEPAPPPAEETFVKVTVPTDNAAGVDTKLPLEWTIDEKAGKPTFMGINIFPCGPDGKETANAAVILKNVMDPALLGLRKWTAFAADVDKNWMFQGDHKDMKELKAGTKYLMTFTITTDGGKSATVRVYFTTK